ncbi:MAG: molecular chaperone HtpG, partial [Bacteroidales bacterium]|nr:molecular chaperone HtpG [Bacteroidales bacterium]
DHEIFLRELVANAVDATGKIKTLSGTGEFKGELGDLTIKVSADSDNNTLVIEDRGIGMTAEEVDKYINQIAFSGAGEFIEKYKDANIIGHFGLGFYSAFMVSKKVVIESLSWREGAKPVVWECEGDPEFTMSEGDRTQRGTKITLYLDDESKEFATSYKVNELLNKYCKFMPVPIAFGKEQKWEENKYVDTDEDKIVNNSEPIWNKKPSELTSEDYMNFYRELYPMQDDPLFYIHLNVDYPFNLTGILYFPKIKDKLEVTKNKIQLYCNQVFVTDSVDNIVPDFLTLLHGVIDSPDIPLNVSRSYLQSDANVKKISTYITKKVADRLEEIYKNEKSDYEQKWDNLKLFIEYGMLSDEKFCDRAMKFALYKNTDGKFFGYEDYKKAIELNQKDKDDKLVYLYATDTVEQFQYIETAKNRGYDVLLFDCQLDAHFVNLLESKFENSVFVRVDSDSIDKLIKKADVTEPVLTDEQKKDLTSIFESILPAENKYSIVAENLGEQGAPILITQSEFMRRYRDMSALGGGMNFYGELPKSFNIGVNMEHPIIKRILDQKAEIEIEEGLEDAKRVELMQNFAKDNLLLHQVVDLALLANNMLKGKDLSEFIKRSIEVL